MTAVSTNVKPADVAMFEKFPSALHCPTGLGSTIPEHGARKMSKGASPEYVASRWTVTECGVSGGGMGGVIGWFMQPASKRQRGKIAAKATHPFPHGHGILIVRTS